MSSDLTCVSAPGNCKTLWHLQSPAKGSTFREPFVGRCEGDEKYYGQTYSSLFCFRIEDGGFWPKTLKFQCVKYTVHREQWPIEEHVHKLWLLQSLNLKNILKARTPPS